MDDKNQPYLIPASIIVAGVIIAVAVMYAGGVDFGGKKADTKKQGPEAQAGEASALLGVVEGDQVLGSPLAPVTFVEFGDFQCPFCGRFYQTTEKELIEKYVKTGQVKFIWRDFAFLGQESFDAAVAARCAGEQGKFWEYHNYLFENQREENQGTFSVANLKNFALVLNLDASQFDSCLDSQKYLSAVQKETELGRQLGVDGTPSSFVNGANIAGSLPFAQFEALIQNALNP
ncbi:MAG: hypothetical protein A2931_00350 [Candidatus Niyogibacteria bacterium RIFCSPLOWO2_01_FULL_45_48]|uniref:Thioredoxin domain-containing protein n=2 Tax=Candidatus Niyogiibacteriota TaxID=1817912 RepID=A0A1G2F0N6_9BACT|nr:MAG: hypothetical protein A2931_00350 [Candidatus Niyogibacteria bacterium RIFCSPLOWO2_01_FULL_45_48]OGZ30618.1 MAG: hypothetical protein A2835_03545 [Candidatus Niyogibacteria bacterium RIFCSPHIGHO2_01_FULL_45_28]OGZ31121.1 MAG: hypothetical protein A3J00_03330 [Candidatus Niyogibacteria bacterium RIFCSPLOWO2_02_FULL_45_13]